MRSGIPGETARVTFHNFGQAMNTVLVAAKKAFYPSYLVLAEADWQARPETWSAATPLIKDTASTVFNFRVHSRVEDSAQLNTSFREMSYLLPYSVPAFYKYRVHEQLHVGETGMDGMVVKKGTTQFACTEYTGGSRQRMGTNRRLRSDLRKLYLDLTDYPNDARITYYIGISSYQLWSSSTAKGEKGEVGPVVDPNDEVNTPEDIISFRDAAVQHLSRCAVSLCDDDSHRWQQVFASQQLAMMFQFREEVRDLREALKWYTHAVSLTSKKVELYFYLVLLFLEPDLPADLDRAFQWVQTGLLMGSVTGLGGSQTFAMHNPVFDVCLIPWIGSQIADALALPGSPSLLEKRTLKALGGRMLETAKVQCPLHNVNVNSVSSVEKVGERIKLAASKWSQAVPANGNQRLEL